MNSTPQTPMAQTSQKVLVYFLAAPEDHSDCKAIQKHLSPILRNSKIPIEIFGDFAVPPGAEKKEYQKKLLESDIVLAFISADYINDDDIYYRTQKVIERYNNNETVMLPILVRNCLWKSTPFVNLPLLPKNFQPLNNKQFWNSEDDALTSVVSDINNAIRAFSLEDMEPIPPEEKGMPSPVEKEVPPPAETHAVSFMDMQPQSLVAMEAPPMEEVEESPSVETETVSFFDMQPPSLARVEEPPIDEAEESPLAETDISPPVEVEELLEVDMETPPLVEKETPLADEMDELVLSQLEQPNLDIQFKKRNKLDNKRIPLEVNWRKNYYRIVLLKRGFAFMLDILLVFVPVLILSVIAAIYFEPKSDILGWTSIITPYFIICAAVESSRFRGTFGKLILKLQITDKEGNPISFFRALWRNIMRVAIIILCILTFIYAEHPAFLLIFPAIQIFAFIKFKQLFHDQLSSTIIGEKISNKK